MKRLWLRVWAWILECHLDEMADPRDVRALSRELAKTRARLRELERGRKPGQEARHGESIR